MNEYLEAAPVSTGRRGLRALQQDAWDLHSAAVGVKRPSVETVDAYIAQKLAEE